MSTKESEAEALVKENETLIKKNVELTKELQLYKENESKLMKKIIYLEQEVRNLNDEILETEEDYRVRVSIKSFLSILFPYIRHESYCQRSGEPETTRMTCTCSFKTELNRLGIKSLEF